MKKIKDILSKFFDNALGQTTCFATLIIVLVYFRNKVKLEFLFGKINLSGILLLSIFIIFPIFLIANLIIYNLRILLMDI